MDGDASNDKRSLSGYVRERIIRGIYEGQFQPGVRIRESQICEWLKVSRTPVREAIMSLIAEGFLAQLPARGTVVKQLDREQIVELYGMRRYVESAAARLAAELISRADLDFLEELTFRSEQALGEPARLAQLNRTFHQTLYTATHNRYLLATIKQFQPSMALLKGTTYSVPGRAAAALEEHRALIAALRRRDADAAGKCAEDHMLASERARLRMLTEAL